MHTIYQKPRLYIELSDPWICNKSLPASITMVFLHFQWTLMCLQLFVTVVAFAMNVHDMNIDEYLNYINPTTVHKFQVISNLITSLNFCNICYVIWYTILRYPIFL